jgi:CheY-like chemotaxis protein
MKALRVLVVEDDAVIGMMIAETIAGMGHDVSAIAASEADAVAAVAQCRPELMIVDVRLRDGNGVAAVEEICRTGPVPHVFITGDTNAVAALQANAVVVQKPFRQLDLASAIQRALAATPIAPRGTSVQPTARDRPE